jgi:GNAT superfamily N-acetyltransferase
MREVADSSSLSDPELREQAQTTPLGGYSRFYELRDGPEEVGFAVLDHAPGELTFYSLWIARRHRGKGYGSAALVLATGTALDAGYQSIALRPTLLDDEWDALLLRHLYDQAGYREDPADPAVMRLRLDRKEL